MKTTVLKFVIIMNLASMAQAHDHNVHQPPALKKNVCDRLINPSDEELNNCFEDHGRSEWRMQEDQARVALDQARRDLDNTEARERSLIEVQIFSREDLDRRFYGQQVIAVRADLKNDQFEYKDVFDMNRVCTYLGFAQAVDYTIGSMWQEIDSKEAGDEHNRGIVINELGTFRAFRKELFPRNYFVRPLEGITCAKTRDGSTAALKHLPKLELIVDESIGRPQRTNHGVNDSSRRPVEVDARYSDFTSGRTIIRPSNNAADRY